MWRDICSPLSYALIATVVLITSLHSVGAQVMQSSNFQIQSDSINVGGGLSTSSNYRLESTAGEVATGVSSSSNYTLKAGYQQMNEVYLALTGANNVVLSPSIPGVSGGTSNGSTTVTVTTDSSAGYALLIQAENSPAMQKGADSIADYVPAAAPDFTFTTGPADSHFGFTPEGVDIDVQFLDDGDSCDEIIGGNLDTHLSCWDGLSVVPKVIAATDSGNHPAGATTTIYFRVGVGGSVIQAPGNYTATTTLTAFAL